MSRTTGPSLPEPASGASAISDAAISDAASPDGTTAAHPSSPIPVSGQPVGSSMRVPLGESGLEVFPLMLGGAEFGWSIDTRTSHHTIDAYVARGGNALHTVDAYAGGRSEHIVGEWLRTRRRRDEMIVATRVGAHPDNAGLGPVNLVRAVEASLTRLQTDRIDLLYLDASEPPSRLEDVLATVEWLVDAGKIRAVGAFGLTAAQLVEARILSAAGYPWFTALDVAYNVIRRDGFDDDLRLVAAAQNIAVTPSSALEHGFLAGASRARPRLLRSVRGAQMAGNHTKRGVRALKALDAVAEDLAVPTAAVAIAWLLAQRTVVAPIVNVFSPRHVDELVQGVGAHLSRSHLAEIARAAQ